MKMKKAYIAPQSHNMPISVKQELLGTSGITNTDDYLNIPVSDEFADKSNIYVKEENGELKFEENIFKMLDVWGEEW